MNNKVILIIIVVILAVAGLAAWQWSRPDRQTDNQPLNSGLANTRTTTINQPVRTFTTGNSND